MWTKTCILSGELWPKWRIKLRITEPLTACAGAVTGPWEIHRDCLQHMSYIIASICTPTSTCKLQMCTSPVISVETEEERKKGKGGCKLKKPNSFALFCLAYIVWIWGNAVIWKHNHAFMFFTRMMPLDFVSTMKTEYSRLDESVMRNNRHPCWWD